MTSASPPASRRCGGNSSKQGRRRLEAEAQTDQNAMRCKLPGLQGSRCLKGGKQAGMQVDVGLSVARGGASMQATPVISVGSGARLAQPTPFAQNSVFD